jgi:HprK-related kinase A
MRLGDASVDELARQAARGGLSYCTGPVRVCLHTNLRFLVGLLADFYGDTERFAGPVIHHLHVRVSRVHSLRGLTRPQVAFFLDDERPFEPFPLDHAFPLLEWGLNWSIAMRFHQYLMLHAGVVERDQRGLILPAIPGSGKSTLSVALALRGWRLLSDEFGLVSPDTGRLVPLPRAVPLKNRSIPVIRAFAPEAFMGRVYPKTRKGDVAHVRPPGDALSAQFRAASPHWVVFPRFRDGASVSLRPLPKSQAFNRIAQNCFNYRMLGATAFRVLADLIDGCECYSLDFGGLDDAVRALDALAGCHDGIAA